MTYYSIDINGFSLTPGVRDTKELFSLRKKYMKITDFIWLVRGVEIDPLYIDCTYQLRTAVLIFLN